jgi:hypothetical protein
MPAMAARVNRARSVKTSGSSGTRAQHGGLPYRPPTLPPIAPRAAARALVREPLEWKKIQTQVSPPDECAGGIVIEGAYAVWETSSMYEITN